MCLSPRLCCMTIWELRLESARGLIFFPYCSVNHQMRFIPAGWRHFSIEGRGERGRAGGEGGFPGLPGGPRALAGGSSRAGFYKPLHGGRASGICRCSRWRRIARFSQPRLPPALGCVKQRCFFKNLRAGGFTSGCSRSVRAAGRERGQQRRASQSASRGRAGSQVPGRSPTPFLGT